MPLTPTALVAKGRALAAHRSQYVSLPVQGPIFSDFLPLFKKKRYSDARSLRVTHDLGTQSHLPTQSRGPQRRLQRKHGRLLFTNLSRGFKDFSEHFSAPSFPLFFVKRLCAFAFGWAIKGQKVMQQGTHYITTVVFCSFFKDVFTHPNSLRFFWVTRCVTESDSVTQWDSSSNRRLNCGVPACSQCDFLWHLMYT